MIIGISTRHWQLHWELQEQHIFCVKICQDVKNLNKWQHLSGISLFWKKKITKFREFFFGNFFATFGLWF
jgi:hypothetical protein